jgi:hypothetical protein
MSITIKTTMHNLKVGVTAALSDPKFMYEDIPSKDK